MRTKLRSRLSLLFMSFALMLALPAMAFADDISNNLDTSVDAVAETMALNAGGANGTTNLYVVQQNGDGKQGCNLTGDKYVSAAVRSSNTSVATVSPNSVTFNACGEVKTLTVTPQSAGSATISLTQTANTTEGTFNQAPATFTVNVSAAAPANTAPKVTVDGVSGGTSYNKGSVPAATCKVTDAEDGNKSFAATLSAISGPNSALGLGSQTASCYYKDAGGLEASSAVTYEIVDTTAPVIAAHTDVTEEATGANGAVVNYTNPTATDAVYGSVNVDCAPASGSQFALGSTTVTCNATDGSGNKATPTTFDVIVKDTTAPTLTVPSAPVVVEATGPNGAVATYQVTAKDAVDSSPSISCTPATGNVFGLGTTPVTCTAEDAAGNISAQKSFNVTVQDTTAPNIAAHADVTAEATGPNGALVSYTSSGTTDAVDGNGTATCLPASGSQFTLGSTEVTCNATDKAGNKAVATTFNVIVKDTIAPNNIQFVGNINDGDSYFFGDVPAEPTCTAVDGGSGLDSCIITGYSTAVGTHTLTATATDKAGNTATNKLLYTVKPYTFNGFYQPVDMNGVMNTVKGGSTVPLKFELLKGATELTDTSAIKSLTSTKISCTAGTGVEDAIETVATGGTSLRYDSTGGQFIYNWKTPTGAGSCYKVTLTAIDGSTLIAYFKMK